MTFYLKYRPQTVEELDLVKVRDRLSGIVKTGKFGHAYLFSGPRGVGKTSAARIVARLTGAEGTDVIEMDGASNRGIDDIRELREKVGLSPLSGKRKAYIIDEVHMLTTEAFNALLKTLEEPPEHVIFFLCTTEPQKLPKTVVSRCVEVKFYKASEEEIIESVKKSVKGEKLDITKEALERIAKSADGSFREAQTILEEASGIAGKNKIDITAVNAVIGSSLDTLVIDYIDAVVAGKSADALAVVEKLLAGGGDVMAFAKEILEEARKRLLESFNERLLLVTKVLEIKIRTLKYSVLPHLPLEIAAIELGKDDPSGHQSSVVGSRPQVDQSSVNRLETGQPKTDKLETENPARLRMDDLPDQTSSVRSQAGVQAGGRKLKTDNKKNLGSLSIPFDDFLSKWPQLLIEVRKKNHGIVTLLSLCRPVAAEGSAMIVETTYKFHMEQLKLERFSKIIEQTAQDIYGTPIQLKYRLAEKTVDTLKSHFQDDNIVAVEQDLSLSAEEMFLS
ncbi:DNA polymerase III subunit gamma/tau [Candidatus Collierbacteria bacterium]|nr:DNA polymerase III subunit gamma/tau [Candidatus Collierbacteria bacterium]